MHYKRSKFNQPLHTAEHTLSSSNCIYFSPSILKLLWQIASLPPKSFCWDAIYSLMLHCWGYKPSEISDSVSLHLNLYHYMITSHLNTYYFIPTTITTFNQGSNSFKCMIRGASLISFYH